MSTEPTEPTVEEQDEKRAAVLERAERHGAASIARGDIQLLTEWLSELESRAPSSKPFSNPGLLISENLILTVDTTGYAGSQISLLSFNRQNGTNVAVYLNLEATERLIKLLADAQEIVRLEKQAAPIRRVLKDSSSRRRW